jgi:hypothetical protein
MEFHLIKQTTVACKNPKSMLDLSNEYRTPVMLWQYLMQVHFTGDDRTLESPNQILRYLAQNAKSWPFSLLGSRSWDAYCQMIYVSISDLLRSDDLLYSESGADVVKILGPKTDHP